MSRKFLSRLSESSNQCKVYRKTEPKTFSCFVDKVINEIPGSKSSKFVSTFPKDPNNPYEVLRNKGFLNISQNPVRKGDCPSDVQLNFYSEEIRGGETVKLFISDHHFKDGKLCYSSTRELIPEHPQDVESVARWESIKKGSKFRRSGSPVDLRDTRNERHERYSRTLRSENVQNKVSPFTISSNRKASSKRSRFLSTRNGRPTANHHQKSPATSTSEISICSKETRAYSAPDKTVQEISAYNENYQSTVSLPEMPRFRRDLFVIPKHTCKKTLPIEWIEPEERSHWDTIRKLIRTPRFKYKVYERIINTPIDEENMPYDPKRPNSKTCKEIKRIMKPLTDDYQMRKRKEEFRRSLEKRSPQRHGMELARAETYRPGSTTSEDEFYSAYSTESLFVSPSNVPECDRGFLKRNERSGQSKTSICTHSHQNSDQSSSEESSRFFKKSTYQSSRGNKSAYQSSRTDKKQYQRENQKRTCENLKMVARKDKDVKVLADDRGNCREKQPFYARRQMNPDKIVQFHKSGRRSEYRSTGESALGSHNMHFGDETKNRFQNITVFKCSPHTSRYNYNEGPYEKTYKIEPLDEYLRKKLLEEDQSLETVMQNAVNERALTEYRSKYANKSTNERIVNNGGYKREYEYKFSIRTEDYIEEICEACEIEQLLGED